jgi:low temperature requirement protein LtrA
VSYFRTSSKAGSELIAHSSDPSRIGAYFHSLHMVIDAGIIVSAVGNDLLIAHPASIASQRNRRPGDLRDWQCTQ